MTEGSDATLILVIVIPSLLFMCLLILCFVYSSSQSPTWFVFGTTKFGLSNPGWKTVNDLIQYLHTHLEIDPDAVRLTLSLSTRDCDPRQLQPSDLWPPPGGSVSSACPIIIYQFPLRTVLPPVSKIVELPSRSDLSQPHFVESLPPNAVPCEKGLCELSAFKPCGRDVPDHRAAVTIDWPVGIPGSTVEYKIHGLTEEYKPYIKGQRISIPDGPVLVSTRLVSYKTEDTRTKSPQVYKVDRRAFYTKRTEEEPFSEEKECGIKMAV